MGVDGFVSIVLYLFIYLFTSCCIKVTVNYKFTITSNLTTGKITEELFHSSSGDTKITKLILGDILVKQIKNSSIIEDIIICEVLEKNFKLGLCYFSDWRN